ncbi:MAG: hypothetical protein LBV79_07435 [Candidatus Adiutrix sp.]|jgi:hypothetical protein|nr:hypothetical protein [Candidatus Adiutrix sp.]
MSEQTTSAKRQTLVVAGLICVLTLVSFLLFYYGRQHKVIIDNRSVETADGQSYRSLAGALVAVNHDSLSRDEVSATAVPPAQRPVISFKFWPSPDQSTAKAVEMMPRERIQVKVVGPKFNLKAEAFDNMGDSLGVMDVDVKVGARRDAMVRLVKIHKNLPGYLEEFPNDTINRQPTDEEQPPTGDEMAIPSMGDM